MQGEVYSILHQHCWAGGADAGSPAWTRGHWHRYGVMGTGTESLAQTQGHQHGQGVTGTDRHGVTGTDTGSPAQTRGHGQGHGVMGTDTGSRAWMGVMGTDMGSPAQTDTRSMALPGAVLLFQLYSVFKVQFLVFQKFYVPQLLSLTVHSTLPSVFSHPLVGSTHHSTPHPICQSL